MPKIEMKFHNLLLIYYMSNASKYIDMVTISAIEAEDICNLIGDNQ